MEYIKIFIWEEVLSNGNEGNGWKLFLRNATAPTSLAIRLHRVHLWRTVYRHLIFSRLAFSSIYCAFQEIIEPSWRKYLIWVIRISQIQKLHLIFLSTLVLRDQSKWRGNKNEQGERYIMLIRMFVLKVTNNESKILTRH